MPPDAALFPLHRRIHAARRARSPSSPSTRSSCAPIPSAAMSSPTGCCTPAARRETMLLGADTMRAADPRGWCPTPSSSPGRASPRSPTPARASSPVCRARTAVVAFSAADVYAIAELIRRQRGGAAVVLGALSPRTRNAQVAMYQAGEVDYLVATDAIGMGLNMDVDHVAFAALRKFDGRAPPAAHRGRDGADRRARRTPHERRHLRHHGRSRATLDPETGRAIENHRFHAAARVFWRNASLRLHLPRGALRSLDAALGTARPGARPRGRRRDGAAALSRQIATSPRCARGADAVGLLWDVCQIPDFAQGR